MKQTLPDTLSMIRELIKIPSVSSSDRRFDQSNQAVIELLAEWFESAGFQVEIKPLGKDKANMIATLGDGRRHDGLLLSGHTDTVPYDDGLWSSDPFTLDERDQRLYGLGSSDMKSFFALVLTAVGNLSAKQLNRPLVVLATADEESSMAGAKALVNTAIPLARYAVIGEPTELRPIRMHKGIMMEVIRIRGRSGHSSDPSLGANALDAMTLVLNELMAWRRELQTKYRNPLFKVDVPTLNLGAIHGGDSPNRICGHCETQIDLRPLPGMALDELRETLQQRLMPLVADNPRLSLTVDSLFDGVPPFETAADSAIVQTGEALTGHHAEAVAFATEAPYLTQLGMETIVLGAGSIDQAHQPDEFLALDQIQPAINLYRQLIERFCID